MFDILDGVFGICDSGFDFELYIWYLCDIREHSYTNEYQNIFVQTNFTQTNVGLRIYS